MSTENCVPNPQPGSAGRWYRYFEWTQGGTRTNRIYRFQCYPRDVPSAPNGLNTFKITVDSAHRAKGYLNSRNVLFDEDPRPSGYWIDRYGHRRTGVVGETTRPGRMMLGFFSQPELRRSAGTTTWTPFAAAPEMWLTDARDATRPEERYIVNSNQNDDRFCVAGPPPTTCAP